MKIVKSRRYVVQNKRTKKFITDGSSSLSVGKALLWATKRDAVDFSNEDERVISVEVTFKMLEK
jgi:hypothetical protein